MNRILLPLKMIPNPRLAIIDISSSCNAKCLFCARQNMASPPRGLMKKETFYEIVKQLKSFNKIKHVRLYALGEPLLHPLFDEFVNILKEEKYYIEVSTNLSLADKFIDSLMNVDHIQYSIEGWDKESYELLRSGLLFEKCLDNAILIDDKIRKNISEGKRVPIRSIQLLLNKKTNLDSFIKTWINYVDKLTVSVMFPSLYWDESKKAFDLNYNEKLKDYYFKFEIKNGPRYCSYPFNTIYINSSGNIGLCCGDFYQNLIFGDYRNIKKNYFFNKNLWKIRREFILFNLKTCEKCQRFLVPDKNEIQRFFPNLKEYSEINKKINIAFEYF